MKPRGRAVHVVVALYAAAAATLLLGRAVSSPAAESPAGGDAVRGKLVFEKRCTGCHALDSDREGPHLAGVYGRTSGTVNGFDYSDALKNSHIEWREETLERWLTDPQAMFPGAEMDFFVKNPQERADVIAFLKQQSGK
jgi:cytochrome c